MSASPEAAENLRKALAEFLATAGVEDPIVTNYLIVVEVVSSGENYPWLRVLPNPEITPWQQVGLAYAGLQLSEAMLGNGWGRG